MSVIFLYYAYFYTYLLATNMMYATFCNAVSLMLENFTKYNLWNIGDVEKFVTMQFNERREN